MKQRTKILLVLVVLSGACLIGIRKQSQSPVSELALANMEALAGGEGGSWVYCFGSGIVDCYGDKVELKVTGLR